MRQLAAITRREIAAFFHSITATMVVTGFLLIVGLFFAKMFIGYSDLSEAAAQSARSGNYVNLAEGIFRPLLSTMTGFLVLLMPAVTMRLFSTEYSSGRYDLLASWPVPDLVWVTAKWLSAVTAVALLLLCTMVFFVTVWLFGNPEPGPLVSGMLGLLLLAAFLGAWGTLSSALFSHQIVAYLMALVMSVLFFLVALLERFLPGILGEVAGQLSLLTHFQKFSRGVIDSRDILYFLLMTAVPLYLSANVLTGRRLPARRKWTQSVPMVLSVALALVLYTISLSFPVSVDLTGNQRYSLAPQTVQILDSLETELEEGKEVRVLAFYQRHDPAYDLTEVLLLSCADHSGSFSYEMIDPEENLELVRQFGVTVARTMAIMVGDDYTTVLQPTESGLINAVYRMVSSTRPVVGYVLGHGEHLLDSDEMPGYSSAALVMLEQGYDVRPLYLAQTDQVPANCQVLVIAGPRTEPDPSELEAINAFLARGGSVLAMFDPPTAVGWQEWLSQFNVWLSGGVLISADGAGAQFGTGPRAAVITEGYGKHEIAAPMRGVATLFPMSQAIGVVGDEQGRIMGDLLLVSSELSWVELDPTTMYSGTADFNRGTDIAGPHPLAVVMEAHQQSAAEKEAAAKAAEEQGDSAPEIPAVRPGRVVVVGNSEWMSNSNLNLGGNRDLMLNMMGWLARDETLIEIRGRDPLSQPVILTLNQKKALLWGAPLLWPLFVGSLALGVMLRHRRGSQRPV